MTGSVQFADSSSPFTPPSRVIVWAGCERALWLGGISSRQINEDWDGQVPGVRRNMTDDREETDMAQGQDRIVIHGPRTDGNR